MSTHYLVSRLPFQGDPTPVAVCESRVAANILIAELEAKDPKGSITFYTRVPVDYAPAPTRVRKVADALALWAD